MTTTVKLTILFLLWTVLFIPVYPELFSTWFSSSDNSHGVLVPLIALFLVWQQRSTLTQTPLSTSGWGAVLLALSLTVFLLSYAGNIALTMRLAMIGTLLGLVLLVLGPALFRLLLFPLLFLLFMVPAPNSLLSSVSLPLQQLATSASAALIRLLSIPVFQEGNMLYFVQTQLEVAESCSGVRSLLSLAMLGVLFAHTLDGSWRKKTLLVLSTLPVALVANILRVSGTGILAHFFGSQVARGFLHTFSGVAVFMFGMSVLAIEYYLLTVYGRVQTAQTPSVGEGHL